MWDIRRDWIGTQEGIRLGLSWYCCRQRWYSVPDFCGGSTSLPFSQRVHLHTVAAVCMLAIKRNKEFRADPRQTTALFTDGNPAVIVLLNAVLAGRDFRLDCYCSWGRQAHRLPCWTCVGRNGRRDWHCKAGCVQCSIVTCFCNIIMLSPVTRLFSQVLLLNQLRSPPLSLQVSDCSTFRIMCDVPTTAVFCSEAIQWFPGTASKCFCKHFVTVPVAPVVTCMVTHLLYLCT